MALLAKPRPKLGSGKRFSNLAHTVSEHGAHDPKALAAFIGREKFGEPKMEALSEKGKKK